MRVFVSGPMTGSKNPSGGFDYGTICENVRKAIEVGDKLLTMGYAPYVPHMTHYWNLHFIHTWDEWLWVDRKFVEVCDAVLRLPGESIGADVECKHAERNGIPVFDTIYALEEWANRHDFYFKEKK